MTSIIRMQAFSGVKGESPICYLLQVDEFRFLLDCGWDEKFDMAYIDQLKKHLHQIDAVLLSYPDPLHLGALPYLVGRLGLNCPIYATIPVYKMGQMFMYDLYQSRHNAEDFDIFTLDDVDAAFDKIMQLKYSQTVGLKGKGHGLQITPLAAGHMIGGTIWKIVKDGEEEIVYAIDYNHKKERHLNGCVLESISRPSLLITDAYNAEYVQARRRLRDEQLMTNIVNTLRDGGNVLIAVDTAGRVLELGQLLDQLWRVQVSGLMAYSLALLNNVSYNVVEFAKSQMEWMSEKIMRAFEDQRNNPFQFKHLQLCHSLAQLNKVPEPKVVLASVPDLECGFSRDLFIQWASNPKNSIILTNRTGPGTLARKLIDNPSKDSIFLEVRRRVKLEGLELDDHMKKEKEKALEVARQKAEGTKKDRDDLESSDESDMEVDDDLGPTSSTKTAKHDLMMKSEGKSRTGFFKQAKKAYPLYPAPEEKIKWDDYGEIIRADDYIITETMPMEEESKEQSAVENVDTHEMTEVPTKCVRQLVEIQIKANVTFIDFEGRSDGESIKKILQQIKPRQLILVHGTESATEALAEFCRTSKDLVQGKVFTPDINDVVDATKESHIYQVKLKDSLVSALQFYKARDTELAWIDAMLNITTVRTDTSARSGDTTLDSENNDESAVDQIPSLVPIPHSQLHHVKGHSAVFINEPRLSDFKLVLLREGIPAEFQGGVLICNNVVAIRRTEAGKMQLEGCLSEEYYRVRDLLYSQYAIV